MGAQEPQADLSVLSLAQADQSVLSMAQVDLPPEESLNLTQLVPELDLLDKEKKDKDDSDEEVSGGNLPSGRVYTCLL